jgi:hypothetical protein
MLDHVGSAVGLRRSNLVLGFQANLVLVWFRV